MAPRFFCRRKCWTDEQQLLVAVLVRPLLRGAEKELLVLSEHNNNKGDVPLPAWMSDPLYLCYRITADVVYF